MTDDGLPTGPMAGIDAITDLEMEAKRLCAMPSSQDEPVLRILERDITGVLEHLEEVRALHRDLDRDLVRSECRVRTDLHRAASPGYANGDKESARAALHRRLEELARERRTMSLDLVRQRRSLLDRLSVLVERHRQVGGSQDGL